MTTTIPAMLVTGGYISANPTDITVTFDDIHYSLSTSPLNGGFHHTLAVRNQKLNFFVENETELPGGSVSSYLAKEFVQVDLPINFCTALLTSADLQRCQYAKVEAEGIIVEVLATGGYEATAHRPGDGHQYVEKDHSFYGHGTVNLLVFTNRALTDGAMTKALITITEAKSAAFADAQIKSVLSGNPATGTATDGVILTIDTNQEILSDAGSFSLFGDLLGKAVRQALAPLLSEEQDQ